jgi:hypothetical protein
VARGLAHIFSTQLEIVELETLARLKTDDNDAHARNFYTNAYAFRRCMDTS